MKLSQSICIVLSICLALTTLSAATIGQDKGVRTKGAIFEDFAQEKTDVVHFSVHKPKLLSTQPNGSKTYDYGPALNISDPSTTFATGERITIKYSAPFDSHLYVINNSADGITLQYPGSSQSDVSIPANKVHNLTFVLAGKPGREDLILVVSRQSLASGTLKQVMDSADKKLPAPVPPAGASKAPEVSKAPAPAKLEKKDINPDAKCGRDCVLEKIGTVAGALATGSVPGAIISLIGQLFPKKAKTKSAVFESDNENGVTAIPDSPGKLDDQSLIFTISFEHK